MSENRDFDFCPKCGALMQNGVCQSCGNRKRGVQIPNPALNQANGQTQGQPTANPNIKVVSKPKKKSNRLVIGICIGAGVLLILCLILSIVFYFNAMVKTTYGTIGKEDAYSYGDDYYDYEDGYDSYVPDAADPYYEDIVDSTRSDLNYKIYWATDALDPDDYEEECYYYAAYPVLVAAEKEAGNYDAINDAIRELALQYRTSFRDYAGGASTYGYVTYMDEEKISVVFKNSVYGDGGATMPTIDAITLDVKSGQVIPFSEIITVNDELAMRFLSQDKAQNGGVDYVQNLSSEELLNILQNPEDMVAFYTPVGIEIGFNYVSAQYGTGWVTVTIKEQAL